jgi:F0F1-type ATP synthase assembly protein I
MVNKGGMKPPIKKAHNMKKIKKQKHLMQMPMPDKKYYMEKVSTEYPKLKIGNDLEDEIKEIDKRINKRNKELDKIYAEYDEYIKDAEPNVKSNSTTIMSSAYFVMRSILLGLVVGIITGGNLLYSIPIIIMITIILSNNEDN